MGKRRSIVRSAGIACRLLLLTIVALAGAIQSFADPARAASLAIDRPLCHAAAPLGTDIATVPASAFSCDGKPEHFLDGLLLLRVAATRLPLDPDDIVVVVHATRFDRLTVLFRYASGATQRQEVGQGDYGATWRMGGQLTFPADRMQGPVAEIRLAFRHLPSDALLRIRVLSSMAANRDAAIASAVTGFALTLLLIGAIYNLALAAAARRQFLAWQGLWAALVLTWGTIWSQLALIVAPGLAGTAASHLCTILSSIAVTVAMLSIVTALGTTTPRWLRAIAIATGFLVPALAIPVSHASGALFGVLYDVLGALAICAAGLAVALLALAWRAGSADARDLTLAWAAPMATFVVVNLFDLGAGVFGGGAQIVVLFASALQTVVLSIAATRRLSRLRIELDAARAAELALAELARRDPLTGLLNRRGFVERVKATFADGSPAPFGLLLIDVDMFKAVNDRFGHEIGDDVLCRIAARLQRLERELCVTGRLGGEEFVVGVSGLSSFMLEQFADRVRCDIAACDHGEVSRHRIVTVSIGVAEGSTITPFQKLYGAADRALYDAKRAGRNMVIFHSDTPRGQDRAIIDRDQRSFVW